MNNFEILTGKLKAFVKRFYLNELFKGLIFFFAIGLLYFLLTLFIEHIFWLAPGGRSILFWTFVGVEGFLFFRFIVFPLLKMFRISKGMDHSEASRIIGNHFPEVSDKLLNVLQLKQSSRQTELLMAGIDQKAKELRPIPFSMAIDFRKNLPYLKYAAIPVIILGLFFIAGREEVISGSYERVVHYKTAYEPPAPFHFRVSEEELKVRENESLTLLVTTEGELIPENVSITYEGQSYFLSQVSPGVFIYTFDKVSESFEFFLSGNKVVSKPYRVKVVNVPRIRNLKMQLLFPKHTGLQNKVIEGTGNAVIPEGTGVEWYVETGATEEVNMKAEDTVINFEREGDNFSFGKRVFKDFNYQISTSNREIRNFENLSFELKVLKDEFPKLYLEHKIDSLEKDTHYFYGKYSDDYGISRAQMVFYPVSDPSDRQVKPIPGGKGTIGEFISVFPDTIALKRGLEYEFYFEVIDNDVVNGYKRTKSQIFSYKRKTEVEEKVDRLEEQQESIEGLDESLKEMRLSEKELEKLSRMKNERSELNFNDKKRLEEFLNRQKQQNRIMESYTEKLKKTLDEENDSYNEELKQILQERLENREEELKENEKLLEELEKYSEKIQEEGLSEKLQELSKDAKSRERNLEQLLELTKRFYVQEKLQKIADDLQKLAGEQDKLSEEEEDSANDQDSLSNETEKALNELDELKEENSSLKKPMELGNDEDAEKEIPKEQKNASEEIKQGNKKDANQKQKNAAQKMRQLSGKMKQQMQMGGMEQMQEDADMLRKILDNLLTFSFEQEDLMEAFREMGQNSPSFSSRLKRQNVLKEHFEHIDDSLFSLALRNPMITENINNKLSDIDFNLNQALTRLAQNEIRGGVGSQQYVITGANDLAYLLSNVLGNMEQMMSQARGKGQGGDGKGMQLPDIIQKQKGLNEEMRKGLEKGRQQGQEPNGENGSGEESSEKLFRIFQEQQLLRKALEERLNESGKSGSKNIQKEMEQIEKQLLEKGFDRQTYERMKRLEHNLLDLDDAEIQQGKKPERESNTGKDDFENKTKASILKAKEYFNTTEILNRQSLPLRQIYRQKVKHYFERGDH